MVPAALQLQQQPADLPDPLGIQPVGRLVEHQQPRLVEQRVGEAEALAHAEAVRRHRTFVDARRARPGRARRRPGPLARRADRDRARRARGGWRGRRVAGTPPATRPAPPPAAAPRRAALGIGRPSTSAVPLRGQHEAEQHPHGRGLAGAVGTEEAVDVALADVEIDAVDRDDRAVPLGQRPRRDHSPSPTITVPRNRSSAARMRVSAVTVPAISQPPWVSSPVISTPSGPDGDEGALRDGPHARGESQLLAQRVGLTVADRDRQQSRHPRAVDAHGPVGLRRLGQPGHGVGRKDGRVLVGRVGDVEHRVELVVGSARHRERGALDGRRGRGVLLERRRERRRRPPLAEHHDPQHHAGVRVGPEVDVVDARLPARPGAAAARARRRRRRGRRAAVVPRTRRRRRAAGRRPREGRGRRCAAAGCSGSRLSVASFCS